ncbi:hypothetical protein HOLleu_17737 [Holothuria leucospilota]|uniref:Uncharacterized protein n=1 Tax=Holothuria leucospilota TaxID=206669 RepID=A0A9Q1H9A0_HOLLE|nr:hypothetical protein HOLleu_17737 [Holothuria leucospilota]
MISRSRQILFCVVLTAVQLVFLSRAMKRSNFCHSPQNGTIGEEGTIQCNVPLGFVGVYWFDGSNERNPLIRYEDNIISGQQIDQYNILMDGSLVIKTVSKGHGRHYKLVVIDKDFSEFEEDIMFDVIDTPPKTYSKYQNGELGSKAIIKWNIANDFEGIYWFDNINEREPIVRYEAGVKSGRLYQVEYDICDNGSLVIKNVTAKYHDTVFRLLVIDANYEVHEEEIQFSVIGRQATEQIPTTLHSTTAVINLPFQTQWSQSPQTTITQSQNTQPSKNSQTSMSSLSFQAINISSPGGGKTESSTRGEIVRTLRPIRSLPQHESIMPSIDGDDKNGSQRRSSCRCLQYLLLLPSILLHF